MALLDLMRGSPSAVETLSIEQAVKVAGDGMVLDDSDCSLELREYLSRISSEKLFEHVNYCLSTSFDGSGFVLQDAVNELGRRLGYMVRPGLYRGMKNTVNFDGVWMEPSGPQIVIEVKTTDTYRINLDTVANYRSCLIRESSISENSSILLVVGREDTGDLEAQIRGSKHAWHTRVISVESLADLVRIKEGADEDITIMKIRTLLTPFEYTRLDNIIDIMFTATKDVEAIIESGVESGDQRGDVPSTSGPAQQHTSVETIDSVRRNIISSLSKRDGIDLIAHKRAQFWTPDHDIRVTCAVSKRFGGTSNYWYAYHQKWDEFLRGGNVGHFVLGCLDKNVAYVLPHSKISQQLSQLSKTASSTGKLYWHINIEDNQQAGMLLMLRGEGNRLPISEFEMSL